MERHNRTVHRRATPCNFPTKPTTPTGKTQNADSPNQLVPVAPKQKSNTKSSKEVELIRTKQNKTPRKSANQNKIVKQTTQGDLEISPRSKDRAKCKVCKKTYKRNSIARHLIIHTGKKPFQCATCDKAFFQKSDMMRHEVSIE